MQIGEVVDYELNIDAGRVALRNRLLDPSRREIDSGDLEVLSHKVRSILDDGGLREVRILGSGDLDEYRIAELVAVGAPIDGSPARV